MTHTTIRVDQEVWELLVRKRQQLTLEWGRDASMNDAVRAVMREWDERQAAERAGAADAEGGAP